MTVRAWFPTLIYDAPLGRDAALRRALLEDARKIRANDAEGRAWCRTRYPDGFTSYASMDRLHRAFSTFGELERRIDRHVRAYVRRLRFDLGRGRLRLSTCWVNLMGRGAAHGLHLHPLAVVSGTYYVRTPNGCPGLRFEDPRLDRFMAEPPRPAEPRWVAYPARAGRLVLFPGWLRHEVAPNRTAGERVSVSFNYEWEGDGGRGTG